MRKTQAGIIVFLFILWLFALLWLLGLTACSTPPGCTEAQWRVVDGNWELVCYSLDPYECIIYGYIYDPLLHRWSYIVRDCKEG